MITTSSCSDCTQTFQTFFAQLMAPFILFLILGLTLPIWGGAIAAIIGTGFFLLIQQPLAFVCLIGILFVLAAHFAK